MSKFKVGQRVFVRDSTYYTFDAECFEGSSKSVGSICEVKFIDWNSIAVYNPYKTGWWRFKPSDLIPAKETPKTYTLTPYIKPETVTINGVEYIMTENENVA